MSNPDWLPRARNAILDMAKTWLGVLKTKGTSVWKISEEEVTNFSNAVDSAEEEIMVPKSQRNAESNARLKHEFGNLSLLMRNMKRRYFFVPIITNTDIVSLGLKPKDTTQTIIEAPVKTVECVLTYPSRGIIELKQIKAVGNGGDNKSNYGVRIHYGVVGESDERDKFRLSKTPTVGSDLPHSVFTRRKSYRFDFSEDKGKPVYFCLRLENSKGQTGPWGNVYESFIP